MADQQPPDSGAHSHSGPRLSPRERQIARLILCATPIKEVANILGLSPNTVAQYLSTLYNKIGVHSRAELAFWGFRHPELSDEIGPRTLAEDVQLHTARRDVELLREAAQVDAAIRQLEQMQREIAETVQRLRRKDHSDT